VGYSVVLSSKEAFDPFHTVSFISFLILFDREAKTACDVDYLVGFETEFILLKSTSPIEPISIHAWSSARALRSGSTSTTAVDEMVHAIELSGIEVQIYHGEAAPGQVCHYYFYTIETSKPLRFSMRSSLDHYLLYKPPTLWCILGKLYTMSQPNMVCMLLSHHDYT
jgi:hypothetical protein